MFFISEAMAFLLSLSVSSSVILSFVPTYCNQPSTSRRLVPLSLQKGASFRKPNFFLASVFLRIHTAEEVQYVTVILIDSHTVFYFPPGRLRWQSADDPMVQKVSPETGGASFPTKRTQNICMLSCIPTKWNQLWETIENMDLQPIFLNLAHSILKPVFYLKA